jgi:hypothetical protein
MDAPPAGGKFGGQSSGCSLLLDAPWYVFWPEALLWAVMEGAIATMFAVGYSRVHPLWFDASDTQALTFAEQISQSEHMPLCIADRAEASSNPRYCCCCTD